MMFDAILPEPAALFKKLYEEKLRSDKAKNEPERPTRDATRVDSQHVCVAAQQVRDRQYR